MTYQPAVYRKQGGDELVVASSGTLTVESGGKIDLQSGSTITIAGPVTISGAATISGAIGLSAAVTMASGGYVKEYVQTVSSSATTILPYGVSNIVGTTAGPTFLISNPLPGVAKYLLLAAATSGDTARAIIAPATTDVSFGTTGMQILTLETSSLLDCTLIGLTTSAYRVVGTHYQADAGLSQWST